MVLGDIASGENRRIVTAPLGINDNPAIDSEPGIARQFEIQIDADPHHYRIEGFPLAVAVQRRQAVIIFQLQRAAAAANINALPAMQLIQRLRDLHTDRAHAQRRLLFIKGHGYAAFARRGGDFEANPAAADDRQPRCRCQPLLQTLRVLPVAQGIYLRMLPQASDGSRAPPVAISSRSYASVSPLLSAVVLFCRSIDFARSGRYQRRSSACCTSALNNRGSAGSASSNAAFDSGGRS